MISFFDLHTHTKRKSPNHICILNESERFGANNENLYSSVGLHPWFINTLTVEANFKSLELIANSKSVVAIGECGLDKKCTTDWQLQSEWFSRQLNLASNLNKPLIIHCVRAFQEVIELLDDHNVNVPVIFHGFNKSQELADQILHSRKNFFYPLVKIWKLQTFPL